MCIQCYTECIHSIIMSMNHTVYDTSIDKIILKMILLIRINTFTIYIYITLHYNTFYFTMYIYYIYIYLFIYSLLTTKTHGCYRRR